jgi:hypothetical protein
MVATSSTFTYHFYLLVPQEKEPLYVAPHVCSMRLAISGGIVSICIVS